MPATGIEPVWEYKSRRILSPVRLPVPPHRLGVLLIIAIIMIAATRMGFEPTTSAVTGRRSNQLSHWAILQFLESYVPSKLHTVKTNIIIQTYHCFGYALDLLVTVSSMCYHTSTSALSTSSSSRGLTNLTLWDISS